MRKHKYDELIKELIQYPEETEWIEFKMNWFDPDGIGEYISAMANSASIWNKKFAYLIWGIENESHQVKGTDINYRKNIKGENLEHYLARLLSPSINFKFIEHNYSGKRIVILEIPSAINVPVLFNKDRFIRIGSSKELLSKFPLREGNLWQVLIGENPTIINTKSPYQDLTFQQLKAFYDSKGIKLNHKTFEKSMKLKYKDEYNLLAWLLADNNNLSIRVARFLGTTKTSQLHSVKEFGNTCLLFALNRLLDYGDTINIPQADETNRRLTRTEINSLNLDVWREVIINACLHNRWSWGYSPQITIFSDRIEILSHGGMPAEQSFEDFFEGVSKPVNSELQTIFIQLQITERSGRGVPKVVEVFGKEAYQIKQNHITVVIPFNWIDVTTKKSIINIEKNNLSKSQELILKEIRNNLNITISDLSNKTNLSEPTINRSLKVLKEKGYITRVGSDREGFWRVKNE